MTYLANYYYYDFTVVKLLQSFCNPSLYYIAPLRHLNTCATLSVKLSFRLMTPYGVTRHNTFCQDVSYNLLS